MCKKWREIGIKKSRLANRRCPSCGTCGVLGSLTRDGTQTLSSENAESLQLDHHGIPLFCSLKE